MCEKRKKQMNMMLVWVELKNKRRRKVRVYREGEERHISNNRESEDVQTRDSVAGVVSIMLLKFLFGIQYQVEKG